ALIFCCLDCGASGCEISQSHFPKSPSSSADKSYAESTQDLDGSWRSFADSQVTPKRMSARSRSMMTSRTTMRHVNEAKKCCYSQVILGSRKLVRMLIQSTEIRLKLSCGTWTIHM